MPYHQPQPAGICFWRAAPETAVGEVFAVLRPPKPDRAARNLLICREHAECFEIFIRVPSLTVTKYGP
jgi:hypothetical protein